MLNAKLEPVMVDFGLSKVIQQDEMMKDTQGTGRFFAPEIVLPKEDKKVYGTKADVWALGITLYYLMTKEFPYNGANVYLV